MIISNTMLFMAVKLVGRICVSLINRYKVSVLFDKFNFVGRFFDEMIDYDRKFCRQTDGDSLVISLN
jgi:hypothetical protein